MSGPDDDEVELRVSHETHPNCPACGKRRGDPDRIAELKAERDEEAGHALILGRALKLLGGEIDRMIRLRSTTPGAGIDSRSPIADAWLDAQSALAEYEREHTIRLGGSET